MAIIGEVISTKMVTSLNYGMVDGKEVIKNKSYSNLRETATNESIYQIAGVIGGLQEPALETVTKTQTTRLIDDGQ
ncbi:MAG: DUF1659 domain-containing protein [Eubacteriaceae bacterium]